MNTPPKVRVVGQLRSAVEEPLAKVEPPKKPGSGVFGRMPKATPSVAQKAVTPPAERKQLPSLRPRPRLSGYVLPTVIAAVGVCAGAVLWEASGRWMFAALCVAIGVVGALFSRALLAESVEVS